MKTALSISSDSADRGFVVKALLFCGILSSLWYVFANIYVPTKYDGYDVSSLTVSELSAIGAPTRHLWVTMVVLYPLLFGAFGFGVLRSAGSSKALRSIGWLIIGYSVFNIYWPPMHQRGVEPTLTDVLHIVWAAITIVLMIVMMVIGAGVFGKSFRFYTIASIATHFVFGLLTGLDGPKIPANEPTPWIGVWERINIAVFMIWVAVLSTKLLKQRL